LGQHKWASSQQTCDGLRYDAPGMDTLATDLDAFFTEHRRCSDLDGAVDEQADCACEACGAQIVRPA
jgi:hypothetical protein